MRIVLHQSSNNQKACTSVSRSIKRQKNKNATLIQEGIFVQCDLTSGFVFGYMHFVLRV
ncbi:hypothetical protein Metho_1024 [Methanomethylovorans hollandica DSM 15978]|uniref:Uncharacterized protein n=1 Tax=Methanomethylovorans hollandica (strain DSM 15978 / NBRC 107637 / DMS1) TaxID=867904 RepID=L0KUY9_METHD|nr:hypothetical protein Metho_1024 [Methanomethylovorans hollandica DSM 15978]